MRIADNKPEQKESNVIENGEIRPGLNGSIKLQINKEETMGTPIEYQKLMMEIVYINLPGPTEPTAGMSGGELLHGFLADI
jgi:hypothetical protein